MVASRANVTHTAAKDDDMNNNTIAQPVGDYKASNDVWPKVIPPLSREEAARAYAKLARKFGKAKDATPGLRFRDMATHSRVRTCWIATGKHGSPTGSLHKGWRRLVHDFSHRLHRYRYPGKRPHGSFHATVEAEVVAYLLSTDWLGGTLATDVAPPPITREAKVAAEVDGLAARLKRWESKRKRAETAIAKIKRRQSYLLRRGLI